MRHYDNDIFGFFKLERFMLTMHIFASSYQSSFFLPNNFPASERATNIRLRRSIGRQSPSPWVEPENGQPQRWSALPPLSLAREPERYYAPDGGCAAPHRRPAGCVPVTEHALAPVAVTVIA